MHEDCGGNAYKQVTCDRCGRTYTCSPSDDYYCNFPEGDHSCEACLLADMGVSEMTVMTAAEAAALAGGAS